MGKDESGRGNGSPNVEIEDLAGTIAGTIEDSTLGGNAASEGDEGFKTGWNCVKEGTDEGTASGVEDGTCTTSKELNSNSLNAMIFRPSAPRELQLSLLGNFFPVDRWPSV